jgi:hypothetical protein
MMVGAAALPGSLSMAQNSEGTAPSGAAPLEPKKLVGFMLAHEQFPVPRLVELGETAEHAEEDQEQVIEFYGKEVIPQLKR